MLTYFFPHHACAAFAAIADGFLGVDFAALAAPPFESVEPAQSHGVRILRYDGRIILMVDFGPGELELGKCLGL